MTQEEKAKAYDEALEMARRIHNGNPSSSTAIVVCEQIFPQLSESEDERIRTALCDIVRDMPYMETELRAHGLTVEKTITYLKKQKEQKPTPDWMPKFLDELRSMKNYFDWDEHREIEGHILAIINWIAPDYFDRKEKEQKPAEWSDYKDKVNIPYCSSEPEWSEEDERHLIWLCRIIHNRVVNKELSLAEESELGKWIDKWINHEPQPVQKWDEFDEDCLKRAIWYVENPAPSVVKDTNLVLWLKSLRPSWKPSEEQMEAFRGYIEDFQARAEAAVGGWNNFDVMIRLYEQLKSL